MSDALNGSTAPFCRSQNHSGGVAVAIFDRSAGCADEDAVIQQHAFLGFRTACVARHRRVGGLDHHHRSASPLGVLDQRSLDGGHGRISGLAGHGGLGQELGLEVLDRDQLMVSHDASRPRPSTLKE